VVDVREGSARPLGGEVPENAIVIPGCVAAHESTPSVSISAALVIGCRVRELTANQNLDAAAAQLGITL
jgi:hypothetical protein